MAIQTKRIYEEKSKEDGWRILVDGVWPRGVSKEKAALDKWAKEIAPSKELRQWFSHEKEKFPTFASRYKAELTSDEGSSTLFNSWKKQAKTNTITLLYASKEEQYNHAELLRKWLNEEKDL